MINNKGVELLSRMMEREVLGENLSNVEQDRLRYAIAVLLSAMLEGNNDRVEERMLSVINLKQTLKLANNLFLSILILFAMLVSVILTIAASKWRMTKTLGGIMFLLYFVFVVQDILRNFLGCSSTEPGFCDEMRG